MKLSTSKTAVLIAASTMFCSSAALACADHAEKHEQAQMSPVTASTVQVSDMALATKSNMKKQQEKSAHVYRSPGKPGASVTMSYSLGDASPAVGTVTGVNITYNSTTGGATLLNATVTAGAGLSLVQGPAASEFVMDGTAVIAEQEISVRADEPGLHFVNVNVALVSNGKLQHRSFAIPVTGGGVTFQKSSPAGTSMKMGADGNPVISMPAEES